MNVNACRLTTRHWVDEMGISNDIGRVVRLLDAAHRRRFVGVGAFMILAAVLQAVSVASIYPFLAVITQPELVQSGWLQKIYSYFGFHSVQSFLGAMAALVFILIVASNIAIMTDKWLQFHFKFSANHAMSVNLLRTYLSRDYSFFLRRNSSELQKNVVVETHQLCTRHLDAVLSFISGTFVAIALVALLLFTDPLATVIVIGIIGSGYAASYRIIQRRLRVLGNEYVYTNGARHKAAAEAFGGIKEVKVLGREGTFVDRFEPPSRQWARGQAQTLVLAEMPKYVIEALAMGGLLAILALLLLVGHPVATIIPFMGLFIFAGYRLLPVFRQILAAVAEFRFGEGVLSLLEVDLGDSKLATPGLPKGGEQTLPFKRTLRLEEATFRYGADSTPIIKRMTIEIQKNTTVAFVGETGAGKTTLIDILLGLLSPQEGKL
ncbi:MAG: ATP-binding cassette domain-containing protein, partial [Euryarchaeota archaeon]|nr:ATP-binding cassette domain-containing protein [Euryarchaeota archaeon]